MGLSDDYLKLNIFYELTDVETMINNSLEVYTSHFRYLQAVVKRSEPSSRYLIHYMFPRKKCQTSAVQETESHGFKPLSSQKDK